MEEAAYPRPHDHAGSREPDATCLLCSSAEHRVASGRSLKSTCSAGDRCGAQGDVETCLGECLRRHPLAVVRRRHGGAVLPSVAPVAEVPSVLAARAQEGDVNSEIVVASPALR
jgi:hypothetical protein